ncbi:MAG: hypothetical protein Q4A82_05385 [Corynebacterium sp.]|nr:hypothetical protein [Corynebacterium sp.]
MTIPKVTSHLFVEALKLSAKQREVLDVIVDHPRGITAARIAQLMGTTVNTLRGHLDELLAQNAIKAEAPQVGSRGRPALVYHSRIPDNRAIALEYITLVRVFAEYLAKTAIDPQTAAFDIGQEWAQQISTDAYDVSELIIRLTQMGFDPAAVETADPQCPRIELRSCPFLHPDKETPATVCDMHVGMLAARRSTNNMRFTLVPHHGDALCQVLVSRHDGAESADSGA